MGSNMNLTLKPDPQRPKNTHINVDNKGRKVYRMPDVPRKWEDVNIPAPKIVKGETHLHVDLYLKAKKCPLHERGGKVAFAKSKNLEFGTEKQFEELFKTY